MVDLVKTLSWFIGVPPYSSKFRSAAAAHISRRIRAKISRRVRGELRPASIDVGGLGAKIEEQEFLPARHIWHRPVQVPFIKAGPRSVQHEWRRTDA